MLNKGKILKPKIAQQRKNIWSQKCSTKEKYSKPKIVQQRKNIEAKNCSTKEALSGNLVQLWIYSPSFALDFLHTFHSWGNNRKRLLRNHLWRLLRVYAWRNLFQSGLAVLKLLKLQQFRRHLSWELFQLELATHHLLPLTSQKHFSKFTHFTSRAAPGWRGKPTKQQNWIIICPVQCPKSLPDN